MNNKPSHHPTPYKTQLIITILIIVMGLASVLSYFLLDKHVLSWFGQPFSWWYSAWVKVISLLGKALVLIWLLLNWSWATGKLRPLLIGLLALLIVSAILFPSKLLIRRPRPQDLIENHSRARAKSALTRSWSFPSGDAATVFAIATTIAPSIRWPWMLILFIVSSSVSFLRIPVLAHYPSDVFAGAALGIFCGWLALQITDQSSLLDSHRFKFRRGTVVLAAVLVLLLISLSENTDDILIFLKTYGVLTAGIYLTVKTITYFKKLRQTQNQQ